MKKCASCGSEVSESSVLCPICGGFTEKMEENAAENIIEKNISQGSGDAITDINELLKDDIKSDIPKSEPNSENSDDVPKENIQNEDNKIPEIISETKQEPKTETVKVQQPEIKEPKTEKKSENSSYTSYSVPDGKSNKTNKKTPIWLIILLILLILAICVVCAVMIVRYFISENENAEVQTENTTAISSEIATENESDEEISGTAETVENETESASYAELDTSDTVQIVETLKNTVSQKYSDVTLVYDESKDVYTINIYDAKVTEKILTIQNTSDENNEYDTLTSELTDECKSCRNMILSTGLQSGVTLNIINPQDSQTLITIVNGSIEYSMIHKAD